MATIRRGPSNIRSASGFGPSARQGWGVSTVRMSNGRAITIAEARLRIRRMKRGVVDKAAEILRAAAEPLREKWRDNIAAEGWTGTSGAEFLQDEDEEVRWSSMRFDPESSQSTRSTGRYYNSIAVEVDSNLEVHVGSTIPRPSGRGLRQWSYPEALEYGTSRAEAYPTLGPALKEAGPGMERASFKVFEDLMDGFASGKYHSEDYAIELAVNEGYSEWIDGERYANEFLRSRGLLK